MEYLEATIVGGRSLVLELLSILDKKLGSSVRCLKLESEEEFSKVTIVFRCDLMSSNELRIYLSDLARSLGLNLEARRYRVEEARIKQVDRLVERLERAIQSSSESMYERVRLTFKVGKEKGEEGDERRVLAER